MNEGPHKEPTPPDEAIREALLTLPCEVIALACARQFNFTRFKDAYTVAVQEPLLEEIPEGSGFVLCNGAAPFSSANLHWKTLKQDLDRTRFLAPKVLKEKMKMELSKRAN